MVFTLILALAGCDAPPPQLEARISDRARNADLPVLVPLQPLFADIEALLPEEPGQVGRTLEARAADLRRRAAELRALTVGNG
ncbi:MAG: hypothetical protein AAGC82_11905 [Pseudomonadota bacterium]